MGNDVMDLSKQALQSCKDQEKSLSAALAHAQETRRNLETVLGVSEKPKAKQKRRTKAEMAAAREAEAAAKDREQAPAW